MDACTAVQIIEGDTTADEEAHLEAWQFLVDTGIAWQLQGSYGRQAQRLIDAGVVHAPSPEGVP